jgi:hypothetical protein
MGERRRHGPGIPIPGTRMRFALVHRTPEVVDKCADGLRAAPNMTIWPAESPEILAILGPWSPSSGWMGRMGMIFTSLAREEGVAVAFRRAAPLPRHAVAHEAHSPPCFLARGVETEITQQHQDVHRGVPPAVPGRAAPSPIGRLKGEQPYAQALGGDPRARRRPHPRAHRSGLAAPASGSTGPNRAAS